MKLSSTLVQIDQNEVFRTHTGVTRGTKQAIINLSWEQFIGLGTILITSNYGISLNELDDCLVCCRTAVTDRSPFDQHRIIADLTKQLPNHPAVISGIDVALSDLVGRITNLPLRDLWGLRIDKAETAISLGLAPEDDVIARAKRYQDWPILKIKMGRDSRIELLKRIRSFYSGRIWVDGNGCWTVDEAIQIGKALEKLNVELFEQPIPAGRHDELKLIRSAVQIPLVADQDSISSTDCIALHGKVDVVTVKLHRCGGLSEARTMIAVARKLGLRVMLGCITENCINISAISQLAACADYLDLDGHLDLRDNSYNGLRVTRGHLVFPRTPGIGVVHGVALD